LYYLNVIGLFLVGDGWTFNKRCGKRNRVCKKYLFWVKQSEIFVSLTDSKVTLSLLIVSICEK